MDYHHYDVDDFAADPYFIQWVKSPDIEKNHYWERFLSNHPEKTDTIAQAKRIVAFLNFESDQVTPEEQEDVKQNIMRQIHKSRSLPIQFSSYSKYAIAAAISLILLASYTVWFVFLQSPYQEYNTGYGEQQVIVLADSTKVTLNANSSMKVLKEWDKNRFREVWLDGEAYFDVVKKPNAIDGRFIVYTDELEVEVLGTTFNVQSRHGETQVVLNSGKVKLNQNQSDQSVYLEPGEMATLTQNKLEKKEVNPQVYSSWKDSRLFFENESIRSIMQKLEDLYGYDVKVENSQWLDLKFTGSCPTDDISILLMAISESFDIEATLDQNEIRLQQAVQP